MTHIIWGLQRGISRRAWEPVWYRRATGCIIWLTGPASPVCSVTPNAGSWMTHSTLYPPDGIDADHR
jgi:hypothetical protein